MNNRSCKLYPNMEKLSDVALTHAQSIVGGCLKWDPSHPRFQGPHSYDDYVEAMACLILEDEYRWNNGGEAEFNAMIKRTFNR